MILNTLQGFVNPAKSDRRFFRTRIRELVDQGFIERVQVAHADRKRFPDKKVLCIRLLDGAAGSQVDGEAMDEDGDEHHECDDGLNGRRKQLLLAFWWALGLGQLFGGEGGDEDST